MSLCFKQTKPTLKPCLRTSTPRRIFNEKCRGILIFIARYENILKKENYSFNCDSSNLLTEVLIQIRRKQNIKRRYSWILNFTEGYSWDLNGLERQYFICSMKKVSPAKKSWSATSDKRGIQNCLQSLLPCLLTADLIFPKEVGYFNLSVLLRWW